MRILVVEDGYEYLELLQRFVGADDEFTFRRVQNGANAIQSLDEGQWNGLLLDLCFDRIPEDELLGDVDALAEQFNGRREESLQYLIRNQGIFILAAIREAGFELGSRCALVLICHTWCCANKK